ncbi:MAG: glycosyltransferase [Verrucomicrobiota bacterium]
MKLPRFLRTRAEEMNDFVDINDPRSLAATKLVMGDRQVPHDAEAADDVRDFYLHQPELQGRYPLALLPVGQKRFIKWLLGKRGERHSFSDQAITSFLHETAAALARGIWTTYLINPEWQHRFPDTLTNEQELLRWLRREFPSYRPLKAVTSLPRVTTPSGCKGVNILGHFCYPSGLQRAALNTRAALGAVGWETSCRDVPAGVATTLTSRDEWLAMELYPVTIINIAPLPHFESCYARAGLFRHKDTYRVAYWYWELENAPWKHLASLVDEIWAPTPFVADALRAAMSLPVYEMLPSVALASDEKVTKPSLGIPNDHFVFLFMFDMCSGFERKNPIGLIQAFRKAFSSTEKVTLLIKLMRGDYDSVALARLTAEAAGAQVIVVDKVVSQPKALGYIALGDCFVSLHRSEGFGLGLAEAMLLGKPVIATNYSGNLAFMDTTNSLLVDYKLVPVANGNGVYPAGSFWADPSEEHAAQRMRQVYDDRDEAMTRAAQAQKEVSEKLSVEVAGSRMLSRLTVNAEGPGSS